MNYTENYFTEIPSTYDFFKSLIKMKQGMLCGFYTIFDYQMPKRNGGLKIFVDVVYRYILNK